jgi:phosphopantetheinyl transferase
VHELKIPVAARVQDNSTMLSIISPLVLLPEITDGGPWMRSADGTFWSWTLPGERSITVAMGRLSSIPRQRAQRRALQSAGVRQLLRLSLQHRYQDVNPDRWCISAPGAGLPQLSGARELVISLAHSQDWVACAHAESGKLGIDLESKPSGLASAARDLFLHPCEIEYLGREEPEKAAMASLTQWCRKEAWLKASGSAGVIAMPEIAFSSTGDLLIAPHCVNGQQWSSRTWAIEGQVVLALAFDSA